MVKYNSGGPPRTSAIFFTGWSIPFLACNGTPVALHAAMLFIAREIQGVDAAAAPEVHRRVDDEMLDSGVGARAGWPWALFALGMAAAVGSFFIFTPY